MGVCYGYLMLVTRQYNPSWFSILRIEATVGGTARGYAETERSFWARDPSRGTRRAVWLSTDSETVHHTIGRIMCWTHTLASHSIAP